MLIARFSSAANMSCEEISIRIMLKCIIRGVVGVVGYCVGLSGSRRDQSETANKNALTNAIKAYSK